MSFAVLWTSPQELVSGAAASPQFQDVGVCTVLVMIQFPSEIKSRIKLTATDLISDGFTTHGHRVSQCYCICAECCLIRLLCWRPLLSFSVPSDWQLSVVKLTAQCDGDTSGFVCVCVCVSHCVRWSREVTVDPRRHDFSLRVLKAHRCVSKAAGYRRSVKTSSVIVRIIKFEPQQTANHTAHQALCDHEEGDVGRVTGVCYCVQNTYDAVVSWRCSQRIKLYRAHRTSAIL